MPVQAQAAGRPVIAFRGGGALDTVIPGHTGEFFTEQSVEALTAVLQRFDPNTYDPQAIRAHAMRFDSAVFEQQSPASSSAPGKSSRHTASLPASSRHAVAGQPFFLAIPGCAIICAVSAHDWIKAGVDDYRPECCRAHH